jgi:hypothetical protein
MHRLRRRRPVSRFIANVVTVQCTQSLSTSNVGHAIPPLTGKLGVPRFL